MTERPSPEGQPKGKDVDGGGAPMERFRSLTSGLLKVTPEQMREQQELYAQKSALKKRDIKSS